VIAPAIGAAARSPGTLRPRWRGLRRLGLAVACVAAATSCGAAQLALLVGVGRYPELAPALQLRAPANDVRLMRDVLRQRGFEAANIDVLSDGADDAALPTHDAIVAALQRLARRARAGDTVYLHFSGHGSLQPVTAPEAATTTPRWQPVFLPRDAKGWDGQARATVANALSDTTLRGLIDRINDSGAFVFAVFDACHSARLVRGALPGTDGSRVRVRQVAPEALGLAGGPALEVLPTWAAPAGASPSTGTSSRGAAVEGAAGRHPGRGQAAYFYAAQSLEMAASLPLRVGERAVWHGLLTWHVAQALAQGEPLTHRQLGQHILSRYDQMPAATATPLFSGDGLDQAVFGQQAASVRQWPLEQVQGQLVLPAGALSGLAEGALFALLADPLAPAAPGGAEARPPRGTLGFARVKSLEAERALLEPVAWQGWAAPSPPALAPGTWARLVRNPPSFALRVGVEPGDCTGDCPAARALAQLQRQAIPGIDVRWVAPTEADVRLRATDRGVQVQPHGVDATDAAWGVSAPAQADAAALEALVQDIAGALHRIARIRNLLQLSARMVARRPPADLQLTLKVRRHGGTAEMPVAREQLAALQPGDVLVLEGRNAAGDPLDVAAFWLAADQGIRRLFPMDARDSSRLAAGEPLRPVGLRIDPGSAGTERLLVLSLPMRRGHEANDFRFLEQSPLARLRGSDDADLLALFDACFADYRSRAGGASPALPVERLGMQVFTFRIGP